MRSFATITLIIVAALSTFTNAAPITLPGASAPGVKSEVTGLTQKVDLPSIRRENEIGASVKAETPSVAVVFTNVFTQIRPLTDQLSES